MTQREIVELITARSASDGDGVHLKRVFGGKPERFDPFLMLDEFGSRNPKDYIGGFPPHPHRGFETVTYMLQGKMEHTDHMGNVGLLEDGAVQWMSAGRGVIHSEMPKQTDGRMRGFQLWVNLPSTEKMKPAEYRDIPAQDIPTVPVGGLSVKAIAGQTSVNGTIIEGSVQGISTTPVYLDVKATSSESMRVDLPHDHTVLVYVYEGVARSGNTTIHPFQLARFNKGSLLELEMEPSTQLLVLAGAPIGEPIVQYGPFVMNTMTEIEQAIRDYQAGTLTD